MHGEGAAEFSLVPQLPQGELLQDFTVAPSTHSHNAGLLTPVDACKTVFESEVRVVCVGPYLN